MIKLQKIMEVQPIWHTRFLQTASLAALVRLNAPYPLFPLVIPHTSSILKYASIAALAQVLALSKLPRLTNSFKKR